MADIGEPAAEPEPAVRRIEIVTSEARRRAHGPELRARLTAEMAMPGVRVADLARRYGLGEKAWFEECSFQVTLEIDKPRGSKGFRVLGSTLIRTASMARVLSSMMANGTAYRRLPQAA